MKIKLHSSVDAVHSKTSQEHKGSKIMNRFTIHNVTEAQIERKTAKLDSGEIFAFTNIRITDEDGNRVEITLHHELDVADSLLRRAVKADFID